MRHARTRNGFTLLELLTVVAIMAILMAVMFPVFKTAKENSRKASCISKMHTIGSALQQYQLDNHRYPRCLLGYYSATGEPMTSCTDGLYPEYVRSIKDFTCDSASGNVDDEMVVDPPPLGGGTEKLHYYVGDSYDWTNSALLGSPTATYTTIWASVLANVAQYTVCDGPGDTSDKQLRDFSRQLRFKNADSTAVVTWCMNHRGGGDVAEVLFLNGAVSQVILDKMSPQVAAPSGKMMWRALP